MRHDHRFTRRHLLTAASAAAGGALLAKGGFAPSRAGAQDADAAPLGGTVRMQFNTPATLNPLFSTAGVDQGIEKQIYGALVAMTYEIQPQMDLAESVEITPDAMEFTFTLREGLIFHDGEPLDSDDVLFTYHRALDPRTNSFWRSRFASLDGATEFDGETVADIPGIQAPDERTIVMRLVASDSTWLMTLGDFAGFCILPRHAFGDIAPQDLQAAPFSLNPGPGAGAFQFDEYVPDQYLSISRFDGYDPPKANIDRLILNILPASVTAMSQLQNGEIDLLAVPVPDMGLVENNPNLVLTAEPSIMLMFLIPNLQRPAFQDKRVRQAMHHALDRETIVSEVYRGYAQVINSPLFAWEWEEGEPEGLNPYPYDPDQARALLAEANWNSDDHDIVMHYIPGDPFGESLINIIQQSFADVGINFDLMAVDVPDYTNRLISGARDGQPGDFDLILGSGGVMGGEPNVLARYFDTASATPFGANYAHYSNPVVDDLLVQGRATTDLAERKRIYTELAKILNDEAIWVYLWQLYSIYGVNQRLKGFVPPGHPGRLISSAHLWHVEE